MHCVCSTFYVTKSGFRECVVTLTLFIMQVIFVKLARCYSYDESLNKSIS